MAVASPEFADGPVAAAVNGAVNAVNAITPIAPPMPELEAGILRIFLCESSQKPRIRSPSGISWGARRSFEAAPDTPRGRKHRRTSAEAVIEINTFV